ncbi:MAG: class I SAM-dependent methyltransferase [Bacteroidota bacterium]
MFRLITSPQKDPFGQAVWDYFRGNLKAEITVYSDAALEDVIPTAYLFRTLSQMPELEQKALTYCQGKTLDIGAGAGSHSLVLQNMGISVTAIDISPGAVSLMEARGVKSVRHMDVFSLREEKYDTHLLMMNGIGLVGDLKGLNTYLEAARDWLNPGGQIILDSSDLMYLYEDNDEQLPGDQYYGIIRYQMAYKESLSEPFDWLYIDAPKLARHARKYGYQMEILGEGNHYEYLAKLTVN